MYLARSALIAHITTFLELALLTLISVAGEQQLKLEATCSADVHVGAPSDSCVPHGVTCRQNEDRMGSNYRICLANLKMATTAVPFCIVPWESTMRDVNGVDVASNSSDMFQFLGGYSFGPLCCKDARLEFGDPAIRLDPSVREKAFGFYMGAWKPELHLFTTAGPNAVLHIRRGDVCQACRKSKFYWQSNERVQTCLAHPAFRHFDRILIFSEGNMDDFGSLTALPNLEFHLNMDVYSTYHHMVMADVLIVGKGNFAFTASYLNHGAVYSYGWEGSPLDEVKDMPNFVSRC